MKHGRSELAQKYKNWLKFKIYLNQPTKYYITAYHEQERHHSPQTNTTIGEIPKTEMSSGKEITD